MKRGQPTGDSAALIENFDEFKVRCAAGLPAFGSGTTGTQAADSKASSAACGNSTAKK